MSKHRQFQGCALVTGGANRIGKGISLKLSSLGFDIALHHNASERAAQETAKEIRKQKSRCTIFSCDLNNETQTKSLLTKIARSFPNITLLINNASIFEPSKLLPGSLNTFNRHMNINLKAPYILTCAFAEKCKKGQIINILDTHITQNKTAHIAYLLSKKALESLTHLSATALAPSIRVNGIAPGVILPPKGKRASYLNRLVQDVPLKKKGDIDHITQSVQFLLENDDLTGQIIFVDGGEHLK